VSTVPPSDAAPVRTLIMVHGGGHKPARDVLESLWREALAAGLDRDYADAGGRAMLDDARVELAYYGDLINPVLAGTGATPDPALDLEDRRRDLQRLAALSSKRKFRRVHYEAVPGKSAMRELVADVAAPVLTALRLADPVLARKLPTLAAYLAADGELRRACEDRLLGALVPPLGRGDDVLLLSHAMGSVVAYDALWRLSHDAEWQTPSRANTSSSACAAPANPPRAVTWTRSSTGTTWPPRTTSTATIRPSPTISLRC